MSEAATGISYQGGYAQIPLNAPIIRTYTHDVPYWYVQGKSKTLNVKQIEYELQKSIETKWAECVSGLEPLGYTVNQKFPAEAQVTIEDSKLKAKVQTNAEFHKGSAVFAVPTVSIDDENYLGRIITASDAFVQKIDRDPSMIELTHFSAYPKVEGEIYDWDDENKVVFVRENPEEGGDPQHFLAFAVQLQPQMRNQTPIVATIPDQTVKAGQVLEIPVSAMDQENDPIYFEPLTNDFKFKGDTIVFASIEPGNRTEFFKVVDTYGNSRIMSFDVQVTE
jgi:hypothetical protein